MIKENLFKEIFILNTLQKKKKKICKFSLRKNKNFIYIENSTEKSKSLLCKSKFQT